MELILALAAGVTVGAAVLVTFGVPDRRIGPGGIAAALLDSGLPVDSVRPAEVETKGSRKFAAVLADGRRLFVKALGSDQRDADLLYRAYRRCGCGTSATPGPPPRSSRRSSVRPLSVSWPNGPGCPCPAPTGLSAGYLLCHAS